MEMRTAASERNKASRKLNMLKSKGAHNLHPRVLKY